ncbi:MAG: hypothetical protein H6R04_2093 [Burkholderiaceae bacterium]|nr:hypothetical protein [Burkholderiaceae bacterium]
MRTKITALILILTLTVTGCANMTQTEQDTVAGAAVGAALGAAVTRHHGRGAIIGGVLGAVAANAWSRNMEAQRVAMERAAYGTGIVVTQTNDNRLKLYIPSDISFRSGRSDISPKFARFLDSFSASLNNYPQTSVAIIGHTDSTGSDAVNRPLSYDRAASTRDFLISRGVNPNRFLIDGRSSYEPVASNASPSGRKRNRRVEIYVYEPAR